MGKLEDKENEMRTLVNDLVILQGNRKGAPSPAFKKEFMEKLQKLVKMNYEANKIELIIQQLTNALRQDLVQLIKDNEKFTVNQKQGVQSLTNLGNYAKNGDHIITDGNFNAELHRFLEIIDKNIHVAQAVDTIRQQLNKIVKELKKND